MCKAGFAGDDAPRAVFRESREGEMAAVRLPHFDHSLLMLRIASIVGRPRHHGYGFNLLPQILRVRRLHMIPKLTCSQYHDWYGSKRLLRRR